MESIAPEVLETLKTFNSPTVANAIGILNLRPRNEGFMNSSIGCLFPDLGVMVGYAATAKIRAAIPAAQGTALDPSAHWGRILQVPAPRVGMVTDGGVRDLEEVHDLGFQFFARATIVSHAYIHIVETGTPVEVSGVRIQPGDLIHADRHGVQTIPKEIAPKIARAVKQVEDAERPIIEFCRSKEFSVEGLKKVWASLRG